LGNKEEGLGVFSRSFKVEAAWMIDEDYRRIVDNAWVEEGMGGTSLLWVREKLVNCQTKLSSWSSQKFGEADKKLKIKMKELAALQQVEAPENLEKIKVL
jgi:hypothetical protein